MDEFDRLCVSIRAVDAGDGVLDGPCQQLLPFPGLCLQPLSRRQNLTSPACSFPGQIPQKQAGTYRDDREKSSRGCQHHTERHRGKDRNRESQTKNRPMSLLREGAMSVEAGTD